MRASIVIAFLVAFGVLATSLAVADEVQIRVIVNAKNPTTKLSKQFVADAFLKKRTRWASDGAIHPVDLPQGHSVRSKFSRAVLGRDVGAVRRYWAQLVFSGRGVPPPEVSNEDGVITYVAKHEGAIGYVSASTQLTGVKVVTVE